jgi:hypothetical protein
VQHFWRLLKKPHLGSMLWSQFTAKKLAFFSKNIVMINILHNLALFWVKNANFFAEFFGENILTNHNIGPWSPWSNYRIVFFLCSQNPAPPHFRSLSRAIDHDTLHWWFSAKLMQYLHSDKLRKNIVAPLLMARCRQRQYRIARFFDQSGEK